MKIQTYLLFGKIKEMCLQILSVEKNSCGPTATRLISP